MGKRIRRLGLFVACATGVVALQAIPLASAYYGAMVGMTPPDQKPSVTAPAAYALGVASAISADSLLVAPVLAGKAAFDHFDKHH